MMYTIMGQKNIALHQNVGLNIVHNFLITKSCYSALHIFFVGAYYNNLILL